MQEQKNNVLKLSTSGSVDDGKSTLIGRILYDTHSLSDDKLEAIKRNSLKKGFDYLDFSLATDGLVAEREQGITIDVAHIYFSTAKRSYIIADTPGHVEYTRNMVTGASTSDLSLILVDARKGVVEQTKRHFFINQLIRVKEVIVAINKMDLVDYDEKTFKTIVKDFKKLIEASDFKEQKIHFVPISALHGDNVTQTSSNLSWYRGLPLMDILENVQIDAMQIPKARFQVQSVIRPKKEEFHDFRGYAGKLKSGEIAVGDEVIIFPSGTQSRIKTIEFYDQQYERASQGSSCTLTLEDEVNVSRGDLIVKASETPQSEKKIKAKVCWMDKHALQPSSLFILQHGVRRLKSKVENIAYKLALDFTAETKQVSQLEMNDIGLIDLKLAQPLFFDAYQDNPENGAFILIDPKTNNTAGVGFIE